MEEISSSLQNERDHSTSGEYPQAADDLSRFFRWDWTPSRCISRKQDTSSFSCVTVGIQTCGEWTAPVGKDRRLRRERSLIPLERILRQTIPRTGGESRSTPIDLVLSKSGHRRAMVLCRFNSPLLVAWTQ